MHPIGCGLLFSTVSPHLIISDDKPHCAVVKIASPKIKLKKKSMIKVKRQFHSWSIFSYDKVKWDIIVL